jgi:fatty acid desaturase
MSTTVFTSDEQHAIEEKGFVLRMACLPAAVIGLYMLSQPWATGGIIERCAWTAYTAYCLFCWTSCFHETAHQTLTRWRWVDVALGRILGTVMYVPYTVYRETHIRHHAYVNRPNDWELWPYCDPNCSRTFRRVFVYFDVILGFISSPLIYGRIFFHPNSPLRSPTVRRTIWFEYLGIVVFWGFIFAKLTYTHTWLQYVTVWLIPHMLAGVFQTLRKLTEHLGMASYDPMLGTRTVVGNSLLTRIASFMNFDIFVHGPHHRHPRLAQNQLKAKLEEYLVADRRVAYPVYSSYLQATVAMMPHLLKNPGIGMNAGAAAPGHHSVVDVANFPADVVREVHLVKSSA